MALLTFFSMGASQDWIWRGAAWTFCIVFLVFGALAFFIVLTSDEYEMWAYVLSFGMLLWVVPTYRYLQREDPWFAENVEDDTKGWFLADLRPAARLFAAPLLRGRRRLYREGVGARGWLSIELASTRDVPMHDVLRSGAVFPATVRFSNRLADDDAALDIRGCGVTLSHHPSRESPLDLMLATGAFAPASNLGGFNATLGEGAALQHEMQVNPVLREGMVAGQRRAPASYATMSYHGQTVLHWLSPDGERYLVRLRLTPAEAPSDAERGVPDDADVETPWSRARRVGESRPRDYLRRELGERLASGPVTFLLQVQFHHPHPSDPVDWYDPSVEWEAADHPWTTIGRLVLTQAMSAGESESLRIELDRHPATLTVPHAPAVGDPRSLAASQVRVSRALGRLRRFRRPAKPAPRVPDVPRKEPR
jgi:arachidonate 5-lipoxygenase